MDSLIITGGKAPPFSYIENLFQPDLYIIAADSGLDHCLKWGITPNYVIGDMDSLKHSGSLDRFPEDQIEIHPEEKDYSDTELALMHVQPFSRSPVLIGGGEGRLDHSLALLALFNQDYCPVRWITACEDIHLLTNFHRFKGLQGRKLSVFSLDRGRFSCRSIGLQWELNDLDWSCGASSLSNRVNQDTLELEIISGRGLVMISIPESGHRG